MNLDGVVAHGNTDVGILRDALVRAGIPDANWRPQLRQACEMMCAFVEREKHGFCASALPGVQSVLKHLRDKGALLGVATGNLAVIGKLKLQHCGLLNRFDFGGYSDEFEYRRDVFGAAMRKARELAGDSAALCVVGDTPADIQAAKHNGLEVIAVATGIYSAEQLEAERPELCVASMEVLLGLTAQPQPS
jgi:phosphoglycolate phosphatase-like HAD superfamily hydrolase